ncbi:MAG: ABC transporter ATP-binding protein [Candidatus Hodarchaeota archaeon]
MIYEKENNNFKISISLRNVFKKYESGFQEIIAVKNFSLDIKEGEVAIILGPSGCGKSTVVRLIAGLENLQAGRIVVKGESVLKPSNYCSMVFQSYTSFPWLTVKENIEFGLHYSGNFSQKEIGKIALEYAREVGLEEFKDAYISTLSGGMKQRVAIASAIATNPSILLMDEPFGALDSQTRMVMQEHLLTIVERTDKTVVFVTHDIEEALLLGDRIYICSARPATVIAEIDVPFEHPRNISTRNKKEFFNMKHEIFNLLREHIFEEQLREKYKNRRGKNK